MTAPSSWSAIDEEVEAARVRVVELSQRARAATDAAREASEAVAQAERADRSRRSQAIASGKDDPGRREATIAKAQRIASERAEASDVMQAAVVEAQTRLDRVIDERAVEWEAAARAQLVEAERGFLAAVEDVRSAYGAWQASRRQVSLATSERMRRVGGTVPEVSLPTLLDRAGQPLRVGAVLDALAPVTVGREVETEPQRERLTDERRAEIVASGGSVIGR